MNEIACTSSPVALPEARRPIAIRTATMADLPFLDALQKKHNRALGYFPTKQFEGYIEMGAVLVAVGATLVSPGVVRAGGEGETSLAPTGYVIARDRYLKRDELGVIYQLCVAPGDQRKLIGASLVKAVFERSAYGCRLFCCWCAQDLDANYFWESLGFVPIAFRAGSTGKKRVHIFWQKRIDHPDTPSLHHSVTPAPAPYWYPFKTDQGAMREDRIVFPIPPGVHWTEVKAVALPRAESPKLEAPGMQATPKPKRKVQHAASPAAKPATLALGGFRFQTEQPATQAKPKATRSQAGPRAKDCSERSRKIDPAFLAAARELRDRYLERVNAEPTALPAPVGRYDVTRALPAAATGARPVMHIEAQPLRQLPSAA